MKKLLFIFVLLLFGLTSILIAQQNPGRFESAIVKFEAQDEQMGIQPDAVLFTGSSSIRMWKSLDQDMEPIQVINRGFGGSTIPEVIHYADRIILPHKPKIIVFYCGENDLSNDEASSELALENFKQFHTYMNQKLPDTKVFFIAIKPSIRRWHYWSKMMEANEKIRKFIDSHENYFFIDTASGMLDENGMVLQDIFIKDNLHMNEKGYAIWTRIIKPILEDHYQE